MSTITGAIAVVATLVGALTGAAAVDEAEVPGERAASSRPNIVLIVMDDMRLDDLGWMPTVRKRIANRGTTYSRFYTPLSLCCPARASLLRGQYPHNTGVLTNAEPDGGYEGFRKRDSSTLATWLDPFYKTGYIGKYMNGYEGRRQRYVPPGWDDWMATIKTYDYRATVTNDNGVRVANRGTNSPEVFADQARGFINGREGARRPFFLQVSLVNPHNGGPHNDGDRKTTGRSPYVPPRDRGTYVGPRHARHGGYNEADVSDKTGPVAERPLLTQRQRRNLVHANRQRRESLASADRAVRQVLSVLRRTGQLDDTYVIFTSDNGYMLGEHRFYDVKDLPYEESSHLPLLIRGPGVPVRRWDTMAATPDLARTVLDMANLSPRRVAPRVRLDGRSVLPSRGRFETGRRRAILLEAARLPEDPEDGGAVRFAAKRTVADTAFVYRGVVTKRWKLIEWHPSDPERRAFELYDLRTDPHEVANAYGRPGTGRATRALQRRLHDLWMCAGRQCRR